MTEAFTLTALSMPSSLAFFSDTNTAAAEPSTFTEHISFEFGYEIISAFITSSKGVSILYMALGFIVE